MERVKKYLAIFLITMICMSCMVVTAFAASASQDGLDVNLTTNASEYAEGERMTVTLTVTNTNSIAISNVSLETILPSGCVLATGTSTTKQIRSLGAGETATQTITCTAGLLDVPETGDNSNIFLWIVVLFSCVVGVTVIVIHSRKKAKSALLWMFCFGILWTIPLVLFAQADVETKTITLAQQVKINDTYVKVNALVKYDMERPSEAEEYYRDTAKIIEVKDAEVSENVQTEKEAITFLKERGFTNCDVIYEYSLTGEYIGEHVASQDSSTKHPIYITEYHSENGDYWILYVIDGQIFANSLGYNLKSDSDVQLLISESNTLVSYDDENNNFFVNIPYESTTIVKTVERIDTDTLDRLTEEEINKL